MRLYIQLQNQHFLKTFDEQKQKTGIDNYNFVMITLILFYQKCVLKSINKFFIFSEIKEKTISIPGSLLNIPTRKVVGLR